MSLNAKQAKVVHKIYDTYVIEKQTNPESKTIYETIWKSLKGLEKREILSHLKKNRTSKQTPLKFLTNVIYNDNAISYNGIFSYDLDVKDELMENYFESIKKKQLSYDALKLSGESIIGGTVEFFLFMENLAIIPDLLYETAESLRKRKGKTLEDVEGDRLQMRHGGETKKTLTNFKKDKATYNYRSKVGGKELHMSELKAQTKLFDFIANNADFKKFHSTYEDAVRELALKNAKNYRTREQKSLTARQNVYQSSIEYYEAFIDGTMGKISKEEKKHYQQQVKLYNEKLEKISNELQLLKSEQGQLVDAYISGLSGELFQKIYLKDYTRNIRQRKKLAFNLIFKKLIYTKKAKQGELEVHLLPFTAKVLGLTKGPHKLIIK